MNPNLLNSMVKKQAKKHKKLERSNKKEFIGYDREQKRIQTFSELASRNLKILGRAQDIHRSLADQKNPKLDTWVVLRKGDEKMGWIFALVSLGHSKYGSSAQFTVTTADNNLAQRLIKHPNSRPYNSDEKNKEAQGKEVRDVEKSYLIHPEDPDPLNAEILRLAYEDTSKRKFSPIKALNRLLERTAMDEKLIKLERTASIIEASMMDPELNPHLQDRIQQNALAISSAPQLESRTA